MFEDLHIDHLVVVTGPTSSGKSTLQELIAADTINGEMRSLLPKNISGWFQLCHRDYDGSLVSSMDKPVKGIVLHYDMMRPFKKFLPGYEEDVITTLIERANKVTVLIIKPEMDVLLDQLKRSELGGNGLKKKPGGLGLRTAMTRAVQFIPPGLRKLIKKKLSPDKKLTVTDFNEVLFFKYQEEGWLDEWFRKLDLYLKEKADAGYIIDHHYVRSSPDDMTQWEVLK